MVIYGQRGIRREGRPSFAKVKGSSQIVTRCVPGIRDGVGYGTPLAMAQKKAYWSSRKCRQFQFYTHLNHPSPLVLPKCVTQHVAAQLGEGVNVHQTSTIHNIVGRVNHIALCKSASGEND